MENVSELVLASSNAGKLRELSAMLNPLGIKVRQQNEWNVEDVVEDGMTFIENALKKARHAAFYTGLPALGDDSGLVVDALHGQPGIFSARYAGPDADDKSNNRKLLSAMQHVPEEHRDAHFYCAMALCRYAEDPAPLIATGIWDGRILFEEQGDGGFGYDPLFWLSSHGCTSAQLPPQEKNRLSHRGQALAALLAQLRQSTTE